MEQLRVFISSRMTELRDVREVVTAALQNKGIHAWIFETDAGARPEDVQATSLQEVEKADIYVGLFGQSYGEVTMQEYRRAVELHKPRFVYIRDKDSQREPRLERFLHDEVYDLRHGVTYAYFDSVVRLCDRVTDDIMAWLIRQHREMTAEIARAQVSQDDIARLQAEVDRLQAVSASRLPQGTPADYLAQELRAWWQTLGYQREKHEQRTADYFEWIINIPGRRGYDRVLVHGIDGEGQLHHVTALRQAVAVHQTHEGWLLTLRRITPAARQAAAADEPRLLYCYTFDELLDDVVDFTPYLDWLEVEVTRRGVDQRYVPLVCTKDEVDPASGKKLGVSRYDSIDSYIDQWLDDPAKEHVSILGEFGTGKTWFALHYAWTALQRYRDAKQRGIERPRLPLLVPLRDYAKAVSVESLFSEFFFRKYEMKLPGYSAFEQLNRMGKFLLIFDGFDEMAARIDRQQMIDNFWRLAQVVVPGAKAILTCRTEHFPEAKEGRALLHAELQASTAKLTGEPPQFEVLELEKFTDAQVQQVLSFHAAAPTVERVMQSPQLLDLARRPVMSELILEALADIDAGKPVDLSRIYLYAVRRKMERDIRAERTFTSMADKLYFLCELSWEMLSSERLRLNYREFPDTLRRLFGAVVREQKDLDHWHYDMMGQTMLVRNADGDYTPAHRSLVEFFVAYKFAAELGILAADFTEIARGQTPLDSSAPPRDWTWSSYFQRQMDANSTVKPIAPLRQFLPEAASTLAASFGKASLGPTMRELLLPMLATDERIVADRLFAVLADTRGKTATQVGYTGSNAATLLLCRDPHALKGRDLAATVLQNLDLSLWEEQPTRDLSGTMFQQANLRDAIVGNVKLTGANFRGSDVTGLRFMDRRCDRAALHPEGHQLAVGWGNELLLWDLTARSLLCRIDDAYPAPCIAYSPDGRFLVTGTPEGFRVRDAQTLAVTSAHAFLRDAKPVALAVSRSTDLCAIQCEDARVYVWDLVRGEEKAQSQFAPTFWERLRGIFRSAEDRLFFSPNNQYIVSGGKHGMYLWDLHDGPRSRTDVRGVAVHPKELTLAIITAAGSVQLLDALTLEQCGMLWSVPADRVSFSPDGSWVCVGHNKGFAVFDYATRQRVVDIEIDPLRLFKTFRDSRFVGPWWKAMRFGDLWAVTQTRVEESFCDAKTGHIYIVSGSGAVAVLSIAEKRLVDLWWSLPDVSGADFRDTLGIDEALANNLRVHGALV